MGYVFKVLQVGMTGNIGGMETYLMAQYRYLDRSKITYDFVNITADTPMVYTKEIEANGDKVYAITRRSKNPLQHYWEWYKLLKTHKGQYAAITLNACHMYYVYPLFIGKIMGIKMRVMHSHNSGDEVKLGLVRKLIIFFNKEVLSFSATDYWACSESAGKWMFGNKNFKIIHNAIDVDKFKYNELTRDKARAQMGIEDRFVIGHVGRFSYQKNHAFIIDIFNETHKKRTDAILMLIGDAVGDDTYLKDAIAKINKFGLSDRVMLLGLRQDVDELLQVMDCFILPSHFEGLSVVGIEAQTAGLPCFFSDKISPETAVTDLVHYLPTYDARVWATAISGVKISNHRDSLQQIIKAGYGIKTEVIKTQNYYLQRN